MTETSHDNYRLLRVAVERSLVEQLESSMLALGALSCTLEDAADSPIHEPAPGETPLWHDLILTGMFSEDTDTGLLVAALCNRHPFLQAADVSVQMLAGQAWERAWMEGYKPTHITDGLWVVPTFCDAPDPRATNITMDPGLAFGSGTHATTMLCLSWLASQDLEDRVVLDYGCGSGILAIAAALLGAKKVYAFDIDPQASVATADNATRNQVADKIQICRSDREIEQPVDVLVANILLSPLLELGNRFAELLGTEGRIGMSGVLADQVATLANVYSRHFQHCKTEMLEQWVLYSAKKQRTIQT